MPTVKRVPHSRNFNAEYPARAQNCLRIPVDDREAAADRQELPLESGFRPVRVRVTLV